MKCMTCYIHKKMSCHIFQLQKVYRLIDVGLVVEQLSFKISCFISCSVCSRPQRSAFWLIHDVTCTNEYRGLLRFFTCTILQTLQSRAAQLVS